MTFPVFGLYGASKFAVEALTETYRYELPVHGDTLMVTAYDDVSTFGFQSGDVFVFTRGGSTWVALR